MNNAEYQDIERGTWMLREIHEWLMPELGLAAAAVLEFIIRRTVMYGRVEWGIKVEEIQDGVFIDGVQKSAGLGIGKTTIHRALNKLESMQLIGREKKWVSRFVKMNLLWIEQDEFENLVERAQRMARRRGTDRSSKTELSKTQNGTLEDPKRVTNRREEEETVGREETVGAVAAATVASRARNLQENNRRATTQKAIIADKRGRLSMTGVNDTMKDVCSRHNLKSIAPLTIKDFGILRRNHQAAPMSVLTLLDWLIPDWNGIAGRHFEHWQGFPTVPSMSFLARSWRHFVKAYREDTDNLDAYQQRQERRADDERAARLAAEKEQERLAKELRNKQQEVKDLNSRLGEDSIADSALRKRQQDKYRRWR